MLGEVQWEWWVTAVLTVLIVLLFTAVFVVEHTVA